jgi:hypothetical protein
MREIGLSQRAKMRGKGVWRNSLLCAGPTTKLTFRANSVSIVDASPRPHVSGT